MMRIGCISLYLKGYCHLGNLRSQQGYDIMLCKQVTVYC